MLVLEVYLTIPWLVCDEYMENRVEMFSFVFENFIRGFNEIRSHLFPSSPNSAHIPRGRDALLPTLCHFKNNLLSPISYTECQQVHGCGPSTGARGTYQGPHPYKNDLPFLLAIDCQ